MKGLYQQKSKTICFILFSSVFLYGLVVKPSQTFGKVTSVQGADQWIGKWNARSLYNETPQISEWWFKVSKSENGYQIQTHTSGPDKTEILKIGTSELEFLCHDHLGTHINLTMGVDDTISGTVHEPNNAILPNGRVEGFKEKTVSVSGIWEHTGYQGVWKLKQHGTSVEGTFDARYERGSLRGTWTGNRLVLDFKNSWEDHEWHSTPEGSLNSGRCECVLGEDGQTLDCVIVQAKSGTGFRFTLRRGTPQNKENDPALDNLEFVIRAEQDYVSVSEIFRGQVFWIRAHFTKPSGEKEKIATLSWEGREKAVTLIRQSPILYRSGPYVIEPLGGT